MGIQSTAISTLEHQGTMACQALEEGQGRHVPWSWRLHNILKTLPQPQPCHEAHLQHGNAKLAAALCEARNTIHGYLKGPQPGAHLYCRISRTSQPGANLVWLSICMK